MKKSLFVVGRRTGRQEALQRNACCYAMLSLQEVRQEAEIGWQAAIAGKRKRAW